MLDSLPKQLWSGNEKSGTQGHKKSIQTLRALGFEYENCVQALEECGDRLDDAAVWLTQHASAISDVKDQNAFNVNAVEVVFAL